MWLWLPPYKLMPNKIVVGEQYIDLGEVLCIGPLQKVGGSWTFAVVIRGLSEPITVFAVAAEDGEKYSLDPDVNAKQKAEAQKVYAELVQKWMYPLHWLEVPQKSAPVVAHD